MAAIWCPLAAQETGKNKREHSTEVLLFLIGFIGRQIAADKIFFLVKNIYIYIGEEREKLKDVNSRGILREYNEFVTAEMLPSSLTDEFFSV